MKEREGSIARGCAFHEALIDQCSDLAKVYKGKDVVSPECRSRKSTCGRGFSLKDRLSGAPIGSHLPKAPAARMLKQRTHACVP